MKNANRRTVLKGLTLGAGSVVLQPFLNSLAAQADGVVPRRVIFFMEGNGLWPSHIQPKGIPLNGNGRESKAGQLIDLSMKEYEVNDALAALAPYKDRMTILQGLSGRISGGGDHSKGYGGLGCFHWRQGVAAQTTGTLPMNPLRQPILKDRNRALPEPSAVEVGIPIAGPATPPAAAVQRKLTPAARLVFA